MSLSEKNIALFDRYKRGEISDEEKVEIEVRLSSDHSFQQSFDQYNQSLDAIKTWGIGQEMKQIIERDSRTTMFTGPIKIAAAVTLLLVSTFAYYNYFETPTGEELFDIYYQPYPADQNLRGDSNENQAMEFYRSGQYEKATLVFKNLIASLPENDKYKLYLGNCYLQQGQVTESINLFRSISGKNSKALADNAEWYLALAYLEKSQLTTAKELLNEIKDSDHIFSTKAQRILEKLD